MARPKINVTKTGKRYFVVNGRKVYITSDMTKREVTTIYKLLLKSVPKPKRKVTFSNSNVINQYINSEPRRRRRRTKPKPKPFDSTITDANRVTASNSNRAPKDSG